MTQVEKRWMWGLFALILFLLIIVAASSDSKPPAPFVNQSSQVPQPVFQPERPKLKEISIRDEDPHFCMKPDDAYFGQYGPAIPMPAGSGEFKNPGFSFDLKHLENKVMWANGFSGTVLVCMVIDEMGVPTNITFPQSPGMDIEDHIKEHISGWRFKPGWYYNHYDDRTPHIVPTEIAYNFGFP
jgi:hypothetical protein